MTLFKYNNYKKIKNKTNYEHKSEEKKNQITSMDERVHSLV